MSNTRTLAWFIMLVLLTLQLTGCVPITAPEEAPTEAPTADVAEPAVVETATLSAPEETPKEAPTDEVAEPAIVEIPTPSEDFSVAMFLYKDSDYQSTIEAGARQAAEEFGVTLDVLFSQPYSDSQYEEVADYLAGYLAGANDFDALIAYGGDGAEAAINNAGLGGIPFFIMRWDEQVWDVEVAAQLIDYFPANPYELGYSAVSRFASFNWPVEEAVIIEPEVVLPISGRIVPLPVGSTKDTAVAELTTAMKERGIDVEKYRVDAVAIYPLDMDPRFYAAPVAQDYPDGPPWGEPVMVFYNREIVYEVSFDSPEEATLYDPVTDTMEKVALTTAEQRGSIVPTLSVFVEGSCHLCGFPDAIGGCLVCID